MAGLVPAIHVLLAVKTKKDVDARDKRGHDESRVLQMGKHHSRQLGAALGCNIDRAAVAEVPVMLA